MGEARRYPFVITLDDETTRQVPLIITLSNKDISGLFGKPFLSSELHWPFLNPTPARLPRLRLSPFRESSSMPTNFAVLARARFVDAAIERKVWGRFLLLSRFCLFCA